MSIADVESDLVGSLVSYMEHQCIEFAAHSHKIAWLLISKISCPPAPGPVPCPAESIKSCHCYFRVGHGARS